MSHEPAWEAAVHRHQRRVPGLVRAEPDRLALVTNRSGASQVWTHDLARRRLAAGHRRRRWASRGPRWPPTGGWCGGSMPPATNAVTGSRRRSRAASREPLVPACPTAGRWASRWSVPGSRWACATDDDYRVVRRGRRPAAAAGLPARAPRRRRAGVARRAGGLSSDGALAAASGTVRTATSCITRCGSLDAAAGNRVGDLVDPGHTLEPGRVVTRAGTPAGVRQRAGRVRAAGLWDLRCRRAPRSVDCRPAGSGLSRWPGTPTATRAAACGTSTRAPHSCSRVDVDDGTDRRDGRPGGEIDDGRDPARRSGVVRRRATASTRPRDRRPRRPAGAGESPTTRPRRDGRCARCGSTTRTASRIQAFLATPPGRRPRSPP